MFLTIPVIVCLVSAAWFFGQGHERARWENKQCGTCARFHESGHR